MNFNKIYKETKKTYPWHNNLGGKKKKFFFTITCKSGETQRLSIKF